MADDLTPKEAIIKRVVIREPELIDQQELASEFIETAIDRIKLYTGVKDFPSAFNSIAVEVVMAMYRRKYHEGISSENADVFSVSFIDNILSGYDREFSNYFKTQDDDPDNKKGKLVFL
ncbi:phage head-tail connector protein [Enterococcus sp. AZ103]|uniref:phage head-tail connector protein n=1 Tax=Enterococcus sp. AZ103 TaxID=2774628 RepID=UPI003F1FA0AB